MQQKIPGATRNDQVAYLNVGCGNKFHPKWVNIDLRSSSEYVTECNILEGIPFPDNSFEAVYHSQVLEHLQKDQGSAFLADCYRLLKPGGVLRVVVPDLENITKQYLHYLERLLEKDDPADEQKYEWLLLEMYDQNTRNQSGGEMLRYMLYPKPDQIEFIEERIGISARKQLEENVRQARSSQAGSRYPSVWQRLKGLWSRNKKRLLLSAAEQRELDIGRFRLCGEVHYSMYDRYSLAKALQQAGFRDIRRTDAHSSFIPGWTGYHLDVNESGQVYDPASLFMEAIK